MKPSRQSVRSRLLFMLVSLLCLAPFAAGALLGASDDKDDSLFKQLSVLSEVLTLIQRTYVEEVSIPGLLEGALEGATDGLDPLSTFVPAEKVEGFRAARAIGTGRSGMQLAKDRGIAYAVAVERGSPAEQAGIESGDVIAAIDGRSTRHLELWRIQSMLAGDIGTLLDLELLRNGRTVEAKLELGEFERVATSLDTAPAVPVLTFSRLDELAVGEARDSLAALEAAGTRSLVVDLRGIAGGDSEAAFRIAGLTTGGRLGALVHRDEELRSFDNDLPAVWQGEIAVLIDGGTQGAAEVLTRVWQQSRGATLVGTATFGLAGTQGEIELPSGGMVVTTRQLYAGPDGEVIVDRILPDEIVRRFPGTEQEGVEPEDRALTRAIELLAEPVQKAA